MAEAAEVQVAIRAIENVPGAAPLGGMKDVIVPEVRKAIKERKGTEAMKDIKNSGQKITEAKVVETHTKLTANAAEEQDANGKPQQSAAEVARLKQAEDQLKLTQKVSEKGFKNLSINEQNTVRTQISDFFATHEGFLAAKGIDPADTAAAKGAADVFAHYITNDPAYRDFVAQQLASFVDGADPSLKGINSSHLQELLTKQKELAQKLAVKEEDVKTEVKNLEKEVKKFETEMKPIKQDNEIVDFEVRMGEKARLRAGYKDQLILHDSKVTRIDRDLGIIDGGIKPTTEFHGVTITDAEGNIKKFDKGQQHELIRWVNEGGRRELERVKGRTKDLKETFEAKINALDEEETEARTKLENKKKELDNFDENRKKDQADKDNVDKEVDVEKKKLTDKENELNDTIKGLITEGANEFMVKAVEAAREQLQGQDQKIPELEKQIYDHVKDNIRRELYDSNTKKFKPDKLKQLVKDVTDKNLEGYGTQQLNNLRNHWRTHGSPEQKALIPVIDEMLKDPEKCKEFTKQVTAEGLTLAAVRTPKELKKLFNKDQVLFAKFTGDELPTWIVSIKDNPGMKAQLEGIMGKGVLSDEGKIRNYFKNKYVTYTYGDWLKFIAKLAGIGIAVTGVGAAGLAAAF